MNELVKIQYSIEQVGDDSFRVLIPESEILANAPGDRKREDEAVQGLITANGFNSAILRALASGYHSSMRRLARRIILSHTDIGQWLNEALTWQGVVVEMVDKAGKKHLALRYSERLYGIQFKCHQTKTAVYCKMAFL